MKTRLPKALLVAVLSSTMAFGAGSYVTTEIIDVQATKEKKLSEDSSALGFLTASTTDSSSKFYLNFDQKNVASGSDAPKAVVKDGQGTFIIDQSFDTYNPLVVREGTVRIEAGVEINSYVKLTNGVSNLSVGGNNAHLVLDGASYTQDAANGMRPNSAIAIGTTDGAGKLTLDNYATLQTGHYIFAGYESIPTGFVTSTSATAEVGSGQYKDGTPGRSEIQVLGGSTLAAGQCLQFANVDVLVSGKDSTLSDWNYKEAKASQSTLGRQKDSITKINVEKGGLMNIQQGLMTGLGSNGQTILTIDGTVDGTKESSASTLKIAQTAYLGYGEYNYTTGNCESNGSSTSISIINGAEAYVSNVWLGYVDTAVITIGEGSLLSNIDASNPEWIYVFGEGTIENSGTMENYVYLTGGQLTANNNSSIAGVDAIGGTFEVNGAIDAWGDIALSNAEFIFADGAVIDLNGKNFTFGDGTSITIILQDPTDAIMLLDAETEYQGITLKNAGSVFGLDNEVEVTLAYANGTQIGTSKVKVSNVTSVSNVPEPTTATLSLLALAGLAARRRRK